MVVALATPHRLKRNRRRLRRRTSGRSVYAYVRSNPISRIDPLGLKDYSKCEVLDLLDSARTDMDASLPVRTFRALRNHSAGGRFDFKVNEPSSTFSIENKTMSAPEFGNYIAGYSGEYFGFGGYAGVRIGGVAFDYIDGARNWDKDSIGDINAGASRARAEQRGWQTPPSQCGC